MLISFFYLRRDSRHQMTLGEMNPIPHLSTAQILQDAISGRQKTTTLREGWLRNRNWQRARKHQMENQLIRKEEVQGSTSLSLFYIGKTRPSIKKSSLFLLNPCSEKTQNQHTELACSGVQDILFLKTHHETE